MKNEFAIAHSLRQVKGKEKGRPRRRGRKGIEQRATVTIPLSCRRKRFVPPISREAAFSEQTGKVCTESERCAPFPLPRSSSPLSFLVFLFLSLPLSTFPHDRRRLCADFHDFQTQEVNNVSSVKEERYMHTACPASRRARETWKCYVWETKTAETRGGRRDEKWTRGRKEKEKWEEGRMKEKEKGRRDEERHRAMYTTVERWLLRSMCQCVSRWRPAEVDDLLFGCRRRRSFAFGTRSVMESLAAPSVEAMTPTTPLLPPNARRSSLSPRAPTARALATPPWRHSGSAATIPPAWSPTYSRSCFPSDLVVTPAHEREMGREMENRGNAAGTARRRWLFCASRSEHVSTTMYRLYLACKAGVAFRISLRSTMYCNCIICTIITTRPVVGSFFFPHSYAWDVWICLCLYLSLFHTLLFFYQMKDIFIVFVDNFLI